MRHKQQSLLKKMNQMLKNVRVGEPRVHKRLANLLKLIKFYSCC